MLRAAQPIPVTSGNVTQTLFILRGANMAVATDQAFTKASGAFTNYVVTGVYAVAKTGAFGVACAGGIYTAASKGGDAIVLAAQSWAALTGAGAIVPVVSSLVAKSESATPVLSLTTANTGALTADIFIQGIVVD